VGVSVCVCGCVCVCVCVCVCAWVHCLPHSSVRVKDWVCDTVRVHGAWKKVCTRYDSSALGP